MSYLITLFLFISNPVIEGFVKDSAGDALPGATITVANTTLGAATDDRGFFSISVPQDGLYRITVSYVGYERSILDVTVPLVQPLDIRLTALPVMRDDVIISASPSGSSVNYRPAKALNLNTLQERSSDNFADILRSEPGLTVRSFGSAPSRPVIRGFDGDRVLILENGERMGDLSETAADHAISMDPDVAERVEIIRGPAGFLYGSSAMGGVINLFSQDIPFDWQQGVSGRFALSGTSVNDGGSAFGRLIYGMGNSAVTARLGYRESGNVRTPEGRIRGTGNQNLNGAVGTAFSTSRFTGGLAFSFLDQTYGIPEDTDPDEEIEIRMSRLNLAGQADMRLAGWLDQARFRFNLTGYQHQEIEIEFEDDGTVDEEIELEFKSQSLSASMLFIRSAGRSALSGAFGTNVILRNLKVGGEEGLTPDARSFSLGFFGYQDYAISAITSLQAGLRLDYRRLEAVGNELFDTPADPVRDSFSLSGSLGVNIKPGRNWEMGAQLARSFRAPAIEELFTDAAHLGAGAYEIGNPNLKNEIGHGIDAFVNYDQFLFSASLNAFYYHISDFIIYQPTGEIHAPSGLPIFIFEADDAQYRGFEADLNIRPTSGLQVGLGLDVVRANRIGGNDDPLPFIPSARIRANVSYDTGKWFGTLGLRHSFEQTNVADNEDITDAYTLVDFSAGLRFDATGRHLLTFRVENLFNIAYRDHLSRIEDRNNPMPGRGAILRYQYIF